MRTLNRKQKQLIEKWMQQQADKGIQLTLGTTTQDLVNSDVDLFEEIEKVNDHETIWQNITRHINDNLHRYKPKMPWELDNNVNT